MPIIEISTKIKAPLGLVFDLARSVEAHLASTQGTGEQVVGGVMSGLIGPGQEVTWRARHLGVWQELTSKITQFDPPRHFRDSMQRGAFHRFDHDHFFEEAPGEACLMRDVLDYESPWGLLGQVADRLFLERYLRRFLEQRALALKAMAESGESLPLR